VPLTRTPRNADALMLPRALGAGRFEIDATWGAVQPIHLASGVRTIGELELIDHLEQGRALIDTRRRHFHLQATIPGARWIDHEQILEHVKKLDPTRPTAFFCNGPQCKATPDAIGALLRHGYPPETILYYRGGMHDWITLGYPSVPGAAS
jgi:rhodanese-related sulfurtransferase